MFAVNDLDGVAFAGSDLAEHCLAGHASFRAAALATAFRFRSLRGVGIDAHPSRITPR